MPFNSIDHQCIWVSAVLSLRWNKRMARMGWCACSYQSFCIGGELFYQYIDLFVSKMSDYRFFNLNYSSNENRQLNHSITISRCKDDKFLAVMLKAMGLASRMPMRLRVVNQRNGRSSAIPRPSVVRQIIIFTL